MTSKNNPHDCFPQTTSLFLEKRDWSQGPRSSCVPGPGIGGRDQASFSKSFSLSLHSDPTHPSGNPPDPPPTGDLWAPTPSRPTLLLLLFDFLQNGCNNNIGDSAHRSDFSLQKLPSRQSVRGLQLANKQTNQQIVTYCNDVLKKERRRFPFTG